MEFVAVSEPQRQFVLDDRHRVVIALGGRGSGKTHVAVVKTLGVALQYPGSHIRFVAPDLERLEEGLLNKFRELCPRSLLVRENLGRHEFILANGGVIRWRSTDTPGGQRAGEQNFSVFDEAAWSPYSQAKRAFGDLLAGLRLQERELWCPNEWIFDHPWIEVLQRGRERSFIRVHYKHQLAVTTTPAIGSFVNELLDVGDPPNIRTYHLQTEDNAAHLPEGYLEQLKEAYPGILWQQEALGELIGVEMADFPMFDPRRHVMYPPTEFQLVVGGIDWGFRHNLAIVVFGFTSSGVAFGCEEFLAGHMGSDALILKADELRRKWGVERFFCDPAEPRPIMDLNIHGVPASRAVITDKLYRATRIVSRLEKTDANTYRFYLSPDMKETIRAFRFAGDTVEDPRKLKEIKSGRPGDDPLDATEYAITGGEMLMGVPVGTFLGRSHQRHEGQRPSPVGVPFRLL